MSPRIHHLGIVVGSIKAYLKNSYFNQIISEVYDPIQDSNLVLLKTENDFFIELIEPLSDKATTYRYLMKNGVNYHHICYEVSDMKELEAIAEVKKTKVFWGPEPAKLFNDKLVAFGYSINKEIVEFLITG